MFNFDLAMRFCDRALEMDPDNCDVIETRGSISLEMEDMEQARTVSLKSHVFLGLSNNI